MEAFPAYGRRTAEGGGGRRRHRSFRTQTAARVMTGVLLTGTLLSPVLAAGTASATAPVPGHGKGQSLPTTLPAGAELTAGQGITSPNGQYVLSMLPSGDLVLTSGTAQLWTSGTS